ncbi:hypothetical protein HDR61_01325 [bacterium]|nr:hypothetical protein [bacterium]
MIRIFFILFFIPCAAFAMADGTPPVYGRPTLYGEYETDVADVSRAAALYGAGAKNMAAKMPVKPKKVAPKKKLNKKKPAKNKATAKVAVPVKATVAAPMPDVIVVPPRRVVARPIVRAKPAPMPDALAVAIAGIAVTEMAPTVESFCVRRGHRPNRVPDGYVLMPGRPDLMCCVDR